MSQVSSYFHYRNMPMQYADIFKDIKNEIFLNFAQNIDCGYTLEPPRHTPAYPNLSI